jgi:hypothetical protein
LQVFQFPFLYHANQNRQGRFGIEEIWDSEICVTATCWCPLIPACFNFQCQCP